MAMYRSCTTVLFAVLALVTSISAQTVTPSNDTNDIPPYANYPRFWVNGTSSTFPSFRVVPLAWYGQISQSYFLGLSINGRLTNVDSSNANAILSDGIDYISCDWEDYTGNIQASDVLRLAANQQGNSIILYSTKSDHCIVSSLRGIAPANGIFTTLDPVLAATVQANVQNQTAGMPATINPDPYSFTNASSNNGGPGSQGQSGGGPTTAVAMIILYTITGLITALFVIIIVTGAIRAHRHPERYGPSNVAGRPRRSRAKGIARAMLDTIPIVKFGEKDEGQKKQVDIEMSPPKENNSDKSMSATTEAAEAEKSTPESSTVAASSVNADGTDEAGSLGCSICTEDFNKGEEVRVLPCNHKFHPECVDPWLLNVSGTCPLCRVDLRPKEEQEQSPVDGEPSTSRNGSTAHPARRESIMDIIAPPLGHFPMRLDRANGGSGRRDTTTFASLRSVAGGSREDRIAALRRFRQQRRNRGEQADTAEMEEERRSLSTRLRERFRVRTRRLGEEEGAVTVANPALPRGSSQNVSSTNATG